MNTPRLTPTVPVRVAPATSNELVLHGLRNAFDPFSTFVDLLPPEAARVADVVVLDTTGLPDDVLNDPHVTDQLRIPMTPGRRSLNLANAAAVTMYEAWRQHDYQGSV